MLSLFASQALCGAKFYVMATLDLFDDNQNFKNESQFTYYLDRLRSAGVDGIMIDVWWGLTEKQEKQYVFTGYHKAFDYIKARNLKIIPVFSFHQCGGNVGDQCNISLPDFIIKSEQVPFFIDQDGKDDKEYISPAYDNVAITTSGRTPLHCYRDWMTQFKKEFGTMIDNGDIAELEIGLGACGELRYPSYQSWKGWEYPGCGEFQSFDSEFTKQLTQDAIAAGHSDWGHHPTNVGNWTTKPGESDFWRNGTSNGWSSAYGRWYIKWYASKLNNHGDRVLNIARELFPRTHLSAKISGIHWWYMEPSHCAETTAGFNNFDDYDGYRDTLSVFKKYNVDVCFTCLEMAEGNYSSNPPYLVQQIINDTAWAGLNFEGENALAIYDKENYQRCTNWVSKGLKVFTYLRMCSDLIDNNTKFKDFEEFVQNMHN
ncbi:Glycosyl hydrolase family 14 protein [Trichomonas vaginalis G3]|uniref:Beta-amylase n=1 Tax=Trichomonas vaginalis (strain ATCC PRA-98 / G3) TaxID=412133 RepID=A2DFB8_TRIV3|nr:glycosyl hydrolase [Trichomonas vaginalis G3]EAY20846.1 Glycosyl hydrolase family 14 protein [Trichomonas vaginalis G3]KAI5521543.1 glycosidases domain-containing protein [Trichomonas vaginalis G3]|eukprot:XP_001581832.1 glycosyl hydrolase [Trichomonas vaginalis G3]